MCCFNCLIETNFSTTKSKLDKVLAGLLAQGSGKTCYQCCSEIRFLESQAVENWSGRPAQRGMHGQSSSVPQCQCQDSPVPVASQCRSSVPCRLSCSRWMSWLRGRCARRFHTLSMGNASFSWFAWYKCVHVLIYAFAHKIAWPTDPVRQWQRSVQMRRLVLQGGGQRKGLCRTDDFSSANYLAALLLSAAGIASELLISNFAIGETPVPVV